ncbi:ABC transporter permease [Amycolatopsis sp. CA-230715]|uniref:ABC transporter permease n=1 Tax=Amycolatopsis sp. CA-230715 TaxID=2745196 RepID=UPI001C020C0C|nr:ABC transporter permease [Amycolatopsis sp. CA-230715]QWF82200.1 Putative peptide transport permease protein [Amycolatopsis sp. CA-230715]
MNALLALPPEPSPSQARRARLVLRRFRRHRPAMVSAVVLALLVLTVLVVPLWWPHDYGDASLPPFVPPDAEFPLGTDKIGRDMLAQILRGTQLSLLIAVTVSVVATALGVALGSLAGYRRGLTDTLISRLTDLFLIIPQIAVAGILVKVFDGSWLSVALILSAFYWTQSARITRGEAMSLAQREFVDSARAAGAGTVRVITKHLLPNMVGTIAVNATLAVAQAVLLEAGLSFIGLGVQLPDTSLGRIIFENYTQFTDRPWLFFWPFGVLVVISLALNFIGDGLRDAFDART